MEGKQSERWRGVMVSGWKCKGKERVKWAWIGVGSVRCDGVNEAGRERVGRKLKG